jgi:type I restriction enzyme, S subunit
MVLKHSIPRLRFKEYNDQYESIILGDHTAWSSGGTPPKDNPDYWNGDIPWISASSMRGNFYSDSELKLSSNGVKKGSKIAIEGSLLILVRGSMLFNCIPIGIVGRDLAFNQDVKSIFPSEILDNWFLLYWFKSHEPQLMNIVSGTGIGAGKLDLSDLKGLKLYIPSVKEQKKIASFLSAVDDKIQLLKKEHTHLELYKKGVMQKIFSRELRFKDEKGKDFPEWELKKLVDIGNTFNGLTGKTKEDFGNGLPYIQYKQIFDNSSIDISKCDLVQINDSDKQQRVQFGDAFFTVSSETPNEIGTASVLLEKVDEMYLNSFCFGFRPKSLSETSPYFLRYLFRSPLFRKQIVKLAQGSTRYNMSKVELLKLSVLMPSNLEQKKIGSFLSAIDEKIDHCKEQIRLTEEWKKGLLQQMFV